MLAYLDALCAALLARNSIEIFRLLRLPAAKELPKPVREEAVCIGKAGPESHIAPVQALHLYYKLSHLVDETTEIDSAPPAGRNKATKAPSHQIDHTPQMEIEFRARKVG